MIRLFILITAMSSLLATVQATLAASVIISPTANGSYSVQGDSMDGVAGIDLAIKYDSNSLSSPTVNQGSLIAGAFMVDNTNNPGSINIAIISSKEFSGSGQIATVTFASQSGTGGVTSASISMVDSNGAPIAAQVTVSGGALTPVTSSGLISTPGIPFSQSSSASTATSSLPTSLGTVSMPMDASSKNEAKHVDTTSVPVQTPEPATVKPLEPTTEVKSIAEPQMPMELKATTYKGAIENFRVYRGEKSPAIYVALIKKQITSTISQVPIVALSDGNTPVKLLIKLEAAGDKSPNFSLNGAKLVSLTSDASSTWIIDALPQIGIIYATLTILTDRDIIEYPLTLAPPVKGISPVETDFTAFLNGSGVISPKRDLNGDGSHDYLDDFIYTANYLVNKAVTGKIKKSETALTFATLFSPKTPSTDGYVPEQKSVYYTLLAGETVNRSKLNLLLNKLKSSGFQPVVREENKTMDVFRLVTECFSAKAAAQKRLTDLARKDKKAFIVHDAEQSCVVAASFFSYDAALTGQNRFTQKNIRTEIVKAQVSLTTWQVTVGSYNESQSAAAELKRLAERGIDVVVVPQDK